MRETDPVKGTVPIDLDRPRTLRWTFECIRQVERLTGINMLLTSEEDAARLSNPDLTLAVAMLQGHLLHEDPGLTLEQTARFFFDHDPLMILGKISEANRIGQPRRKKHGANGAEATPDPQTASPSTGSTGGPAPATSSEKTSGA